ncbi:hypothetical protein EDC01DRAFT_114272 [Geopyxis carbonaria]|nr:hypothetical protein EDC01DRAFT_114272 [Geopyxis carbonaria]
MEPIYLNSIDDVIAPGTPQELSAIQDVLQKVQRSQEGWQLADSLLENVDQHVQFFGALTFTVKLNSDWHSIPEDDIFILRDRLIAWLLKFVSNGSSQLVIRKLCSTLVVFFIRFPEAWPHLIRHIICCLYLGRVGTLVEFQALPKSREILQSVSSVGKLAALWFTTILVEEVGKIDCRINNSHYHQNIQSNLDEAVYLIGSTIKLQNGPETKDLSLWTAY